ncbi:hypothetical protein BH11ACT3_BH11ACT3_24460 [soil metagenome]
MGAKWDDAVKNSRSYTADIDVATVGKVTHVRGVVLVRAGLYSPPRSPRGGIAVPTPYLLTDPFDISTPPVLIEGSTIPRLRRLELRRNFDGSRTGFYQNDLMSKNAALSGTWFESVIKSDEFVFDTKGAEWEITLTLQSPVNPKSS